LDIVFESAEARFTGRVVLESLSLSLSERRIGVIGLNGSGKTTFARMINGLVVPASGRVLTNGYDTRTQGAQVRPGVGYVFQNPANQIVLPLIRDDIALGLRSRGLNKQAVDQHVEAVLARVGIPQLADRRAHELSGGEIQLAALASVLVTSPGIVIMDEPTNQLDLRNRNIVERTIHDLAEDVVVVSHDLALVESFDRVLLFHEGRLIGDGAPGEITAHYRSLAA
jgi:biotin transport system ATP-binding protein